MESNPWINPRRNQALRKMIFLTGFFIFFLACNIGSPGAQPTQTPFVITATQPASPASTDTSIPPTTIIPTAGPTVTSSPACTVLQDVNLRSGPGTAYNPPLSVLKAGDLFTPTGFNPQGVPGGSWVQAKVPGSNQTGWVSAGEQFVSCNLDLTTLPKVDVPPPPKAAAPKIVTGDVDGDNIGSFRSAFDYNPDYFVRMYVFRSDDSGEDFSFNKDGRGITSVEFKVTSPNGNNTFYDSTEKNPGYCIFGGGEPNCNPWVYENGQYKWSPGGDPVEPRNYQLTITVNAEDGQVGQWFIPINLVMQ